MKDHWRDEHPSSFEDLSTIYSIINSEFVSPVFHDANCSIDEGAVYQNNWNSEVLRNDSSNFNEAFTLLDFILDRMSEIRSQLLRKESRKGNHSSGIWKSYVPVIERIITQSMGAPHLQLMPQISDKLNELLRYQNVDR